METTQTSQSLYQALWNSADVLRSKMDANDYKSYLLGMVFYKYLSDKMLFFVAETMEEGTDSLEDALESIATITRMRIPMRIWSLS
ncbi:HsdM N-terminal domain protein [Streptococcus infantis SK970]|nr:HsdM N-terminal domain protein [Streptococcus infantis SK970]